MTQALTRWSVLAATVWLAGCAAGLEGPPHLTLDRSRLAQTPQAPAQVAPGDTVSAVVNDPVVIDPTQAVGYDDLPTTSVALYRGEPRPLALADLVADLLAYNRDIRIEGYSLRVAECDVPIAKAIYDLVLSATGQFTRAEEQAVRGGFNSASVSRSRTKFGQVAVSQLLPTGAVLGLAYELTRYSTPMEGEPGDDYDSWGQRATVSVVQPLLQGFGPGVTNAEIHIAQQERRGRAADFQAQVEGEIEGALATYWDLIGAIEMFKVRVLSFAAARDLLRINTAKYEAGVLPRTDVLQAEAAVERRRNQLIGARRQVRDLEDDIKRRAFLQPDTPLWEAELRPTQPIAWREIGVDLDETLAVALDRRAEMRRSESNIQQAEIALRVARNGLLPTLNAFASADSNALDHGWSSSFDTASDLEFHNYSVGLEMIYPLQNRAGRYRLRQARLLQGQSREVGRATWDAIVQEVRAALRALRAARESIDVTQAQVASEEAKLSSERRRYDVGLSTAFEVLEFQEDLAAAQAEHIDAVVAYNQAAIALDRARGTLLESLGVRVHDADLDPAPKPVIFPVGLH